MRCLVRRERYLPCQSEFMECLGESLCNGYVPGHESHTIWLVISYDIKLNTIVHKFLRKVYLSLLNLFVFKLQNFTNIPLPNYTF